MKHGDKPELIKEAFGKVLLHVRGSGIKPRTSLIECRAGCAFLRQAQLHQHLKAPPGPLPLPPQDAPQVAVQSLIQLIRKSPKLCQSKVMSLSPNDRVEVVLDKLGQVKLTPLAKQHLQISFEAFSRDLGHADASLVVPDEGVTEKFALSWPAHRALIPVDS